MVLKDIISQKLINDVIRNGQSEDEYKNRPENLKWRVLIVDNLTLKIVSTVKKMHELSAEGIIQVELIEKNRISFPNEAIYLMTPSKKNVIDLSMTILNQSFEKCH